MGNEFNANDIFEVAKQIEQNGAVFYREAAEAVDGNDNKEFLLDLARMEDAHEKIFEAMQAELSKAEKEAAVFDPNDENAVYLKMLADMRVFAGKEKPDSDMKNILESAIQAEKDSIAFYLGMKQLVPENLGQTKIDWIIKEEMSHIRMIAAKLLGNA